METRRRVKRTAGRTNFVVEAITRLIDVGELKPGAKLPSIRQAAEQFEVSKNTVIEAYDRLVSAGLAIARPGSGFRVRRRERIPTTSAPKHVAEAIDIASLLNAQLEENFSIRVGDGRPPTSWTEESEISRHLGFPNVTRLGSEDSYNSALGFLGLRERLSSHLLDQDLKVGAEQILTTFGANHALDLIIRRYLTPGDTVLVDDPGYYPLFAKLKLSQIRMIGVRRLSSGPDLEDLAIKVEREQPKIFFTQSVAHNPTGGSINLQTAYAVLKIAVQKDLLIVEDDPFIDLPTVSNIRLTSLDQLDNVISIGTFSKTLSASLRCGYIAARPDIIAALTELKMLTTVNSSGHVERLVQRLIFEGHYRRHLKRLGNRIRAATEKVIENIGKLGLKLFCDPTGGYYVYLALPDHVDDIRLAKAAAQEGIFIAPGSVFSVDHAPSPSWIRINVSRADDPKFYNFLGRYIGT